MKPAILSTLLTTFTLLAVAQQPRSNPRHLGGEFHVPTFWAKGGGYSTDGITQKRNLSLYDDAGHIDCRRFTQAWFHGREKEEARIVSEMNSARSFIWEHWQSRKRGYIRITLNSVDATSTSHIFIEPDSNGLWQVSWRIVRHNNELDDVPSIRAVERKDGNGHTVLIFRAADGRQLETL